MTGAIRYLAAFGFLWKESQAVVFVDGDDSIIEDLSVSKSRELKISSRELSCVTTMDADAFVTENDALCFPLLSEIGREERGAFCLQPEDNGASLKFTFESTGAWTLMHAAVWGHALPSTYPEKFGSPNSEEFPIGTRTPVGAISYSSSRPLNDFVQVDFESNETTAVATQILATATVENLFDFGATREIEQVWAHQEWLSMVTKDRHVAHFYSYVQLVLPDIMSECTFDDSDEMTLAPSSMPTVYPSRQDAVSKPRIQDYLFSPLVHLPNVTQQKTPHRSDGDSFLAGNAVTGGGDVEMVNVTEVVVGITFTIVHGYKNGIIGSAYKDILADAFHEFVTNIMTFEELYAEEEIEEKSYYEKQAENALRHRKLVHSNNEDHSKTQRKLFVEVDANSTKVYEFLSPETCPVEVRKDTENCHSAVARFTLLVTQAEKVDEICKYYLETTAGALQDNILDQIVRERLISDNVGRNSHGRLYNVTVEYCGSASKFTNTTRVIAKPKSEEVDEGGGRIDFTWILLVSMVVLFCFLKILLIILSCSSFRDKICSMNKGAKDKASTNKASTNKASINKDKAPRSNPKILASDSSLATIAKV